VNANGAPYFVFDGQDLVLDDSFLETQGMYRRFRDLFGDIANRSRVLQLVAETLVRRTFMANQHAQERSRLSEEFGPRPDSLTYRPPETAEMKEAWRVTEALILWIDRILRDHGARLLVTTLTIPAQHEWDVETRRALLPEGFPLDLSYPDERLAQFGRSHKIPVFVLAPELVKHAEEQGIRLSFDPGGHYNEDGHRVVGSLLGSWLCTELRRGDPTGDRAHD
jgi:hypothetical protein